MLIYISCEVDSLRRDIACFEQREWQRQSAQAYLLFPGTNQVEVVEVLDRAAS